MEVCRYAVETSQQLLTYSHPNLKFGSRLNPGPIGTFFSTTMHYRRSAFTVIESLAMLVAIMVFTVIIAAIMRQRQIWPFDRLDAWLDARKQIQTPPK